MKVSTQEMRHYENEKVKDYFQIKMFGQRAFAYQVMRNERNFRKSFKNYFECSNLIFKTKNSKFKF